MKTAAGKTSSSHSPSITRAGSFFGGTRSSVFFGAVQRAARPELAVQTKLSVSKPADPLEKEADRTAERIVREPIEPARKAAEANASAQPKPEPAVPVRRKAESSAPVHREAAGTGPSEQAKGESPAPVQRKSGPDIAVQRFGEGTPTVAADAHGEIVRATTGGQALPTGVRSEMEPKLNAELGDVRVHTDESAASLSNHLSARAFTYRNHVFFARGQYQPGTDTGRRLLAHELTHTIQQGATVQRAAAPAADRPTEGQRAAPPGAQPAAEVQRAPASEQAPPVQRTGATAIPQVQRWGLDSILDYFADKAAYIPGFRMLTLVLGFNPINMRSVNRTPANFLRALIELVPGGAVITRVLDTHGVINKAADWVMKKVSALGDIGASIVDGIKRFVSGLEWSDALDPGGVWDRAKRVVTDPIGRLMSFGVSVVGELLSLVKEAILRPLAALAEGTAGYDLLRAVLGQDPITGDPVPRNADTLIGGFMKLIGQEEIWQNIKKGNAGPRAFAWFQGALSGLMGFVRSIPRRIVQTITSLTFEDVVTVVGAFRKVGSAFVDVVSQFGAWAGAQVLSLLEILVSVVAPGVMPYIAKAKAAFHTIIRDPVRFVGNLVRAGKLGFENFKNNIGKHLKTALIKWLTGPLGEAGVYIPTSFTLLEILKLVLSVLGLTWQNIRAKLVKIIPDPILTGLEKTAGVLVTLVTQGPAAAWEQIKTELTELKDQLISQVTQMITTEIVKAAVTKLVSMLNPAGAVIQAILAVYNTVMFFVEKISQIGAVVASFIDSISAIAAGQVQGAAKKVEDTMANTLTVVLAFLARFAGLGGIPGKLVGVVKKIRAPIDKGLDRIVAWLGKILEKVVGRAKAAAKKLLEWWRKKVPISGGDQNHTLTFQGQKSSASLVVQSTPSEPEVFMTESADKGEISAAKRATPIATTRKHAKAIGTLQNRLKKVDDTQGKAATGGKADQAEKDVTKLDGIMKVLAGHIGGTLKTWGVRDAKITGLKISRGKFTVEHKRDIAEEAKRMGRGAHLRTDKTTTGERINVAKGIARRHVVSAHDMGDHYMSVLNTLTASAAKLLLEERGSITAARTTVKKPVTANSVKEAAVARYTNFFGYAKNIFLGNSKENSSIQEHLDTGHPEMADAKLTEHVDRIKRGWALDDSIKITPPVKS